MIWGRPSPATDVDLVHWRRLLPGSVSDWRLCVPSPSSEAPGYLGHPSTQPRTLRQEDRVDRGRR